MGITLGRHLTQSKRHSTTYLHSQRMSYTGGVIAYWKIPLSFAILFSLAALPNVVIAQNETYTPESLTFTLYRDGVAHVKYTLTVNATWPAIDVSLFGGGFEGFTAVDQDGVVLDYRVYEDFVEIYTLGVSKVSIEYDTQFLTTKEGGLWFFSIDAPVEFTVELPEGSTIIDLTSVPLEIRAGDGHSVLLMPPGVQEVVYILGVLPEGPEKTVLSQYLILVGVVCVGVIGGFALILLKRRREPRWDAYVKRLLKKYPDLRPDEQAVINFLAVSGGSALEAHIRNAVGLPKSSAWRIVKGLEERGLVSVEQIGQQNYVRLRRDALSKSDE
ncbi:MAG: hypothetical protein QXJ75_05380 [Candidatus Bathyarchaeia archaeon]